MVYFGILVSNLRKTALPNHNLWSCGLFFQRVRWWKSAVEIRTGTRSNRQMKMAKKSRVTKTRPVVLHWCQASRIQGCKIVLNSSGRNRFTAEGRVRIDSGWSWTFRISHVTVYVGEVAPLMSRTLAHAIFAVCLTVFAFEFRPQTFPNGLYGKKTITSELMILECSFPLINALFVHVWKLSKIRWSLFSILSMRNSGEMSLKLDTTSKTHGL